MVGNCLVLDITKITFGAIAGEESENVTRLGLHLPILDQIVLVIATFLECVALIIILFSSIHALWQLMTRWLRRRQLIDHREVVRLEFGLSLALSLEFLLAADIVATAIAPTWEALGKLAVVAAIRTFLNYFLEQEVSKIEEKSAKTQQLMRQIRTFGEDDRDSF